MGSAGPSPGAIANRRKPHGEDCEEGRPEEGNGEEIGQGFQEAEGRLTSGS